jgi:HK97 family phage major capsid protein
MSKLLKLLKKLSAQGFASAVEKAEVASLVKELDAEEAEVVADDVAKVESLPENDGSEDEDEDDSLEKNIKTIVKSSVKTATKVEMEKAVDAIKAEVKTFVDAQLEAKSKKAGIYNDEVQEKRHGINTYLRKFASALLDKDLSEIQKLNGNMTVKEMTTDSTGSPFGGYVVDRELSAEIRHLTTEYGVARREFMAVQLTKNSYDANTLAIDVTVFWVDEGNTIRSTEAVLGQEDLKLKKLGAIVTLTRELLEDEEMDLFSFIGSRVAEGFARLEDRAFFMGTGTGDTANAEFLGLLNNPACNQTTMTGTTFASMTADDLLDMQDDSPQEIAKTGKYFMHRSIRNIVRKLKDNQNNPIYQSPSENGPATIWGRPVVEVEVMPSVANSNIDTPFVIYGNLKKSSILGYKGAISADRFNAGVVRNVANNGDINLITTDREAIRWVERVGAITILPEAATVLKTGSGS